MGGILLGNCHPHDLEDLAVERFEKVFGMNKEAEEVWGHSEYFVHALPWMLKCNTLERQHSMIGWNKLDASVNPLMKNEERAQGAVMTKEAYCSFANQYGKGMGIYFAAPLDLNAQADAIWTPSPAFSYLLEDCCRCFTNTEPLVLEEKQTAGTIVNDKVWILMDDGIIVIDTSQSVDH
jgi:hypothetical protein